jgi:hypothetical protein
MCDEVLEPSYSNKRGPPTPDEPSHAPESRVGRLFKSSITRLDRGDACRSNRRALFVAIERWLALRYAVRVNPHPQPFSQAWEKGAEGGLRVGALLAMLTLLTSVIPFVRGESMTHSVVHHRVDGQLL